MLVTGWEYCICVIHESATFIYTGTSSTFRTCQTAKGSICLFITPSLAATPPERWRHCDRCRLRPCVVALVRFDLLLVALGHLAELVAQPVKVSMLRECDLRLGGQCRVDDRGSPRRVDLLETGHRRPGNLRDLTRQLKRPSQPPFGGHDPRDHPQAPR